MQSRVWPVLPGKLPGLFRLERHVVIDQTHGTRSAEALGYAVASPPLEQPAASPGDASETDDHVTIRGRRDFAIYYLPASVPFWAALLLGLNISALTWLIWLELLPRGLLLCSEMPRDKQFRDEPLLSVLPVMAIVLLACVGAMAFVAMFFP